MDLLLKCVYLKQEDNMRGTNDLVTLRVGGEKYGRFNYHHFRLPIHSTVDIHYETETPKALLRMVFTLSEPNLIIHYYLWNEKEQSYFEAALGKDITESQTFQQILQGISFSRKNEYSYIVNPHQRMNDIPN